MPLHEGLRPQLRSLAQKEPPLGCHPGVWLDHFLPVQTWHQDRELAGYDKETARDAKGRMVEAIVQRPVAIGYARALAEWRRALAADEGRIALAEGDSVGRVIVGAGQKGPAEFGITLHHTWGVPILPGSSLKGIAALGADRYLSGGQWRRRDDSTTVRKSGPNAFDALFGDVDEQGAVIFHDAWFVPGGDDKNGLHHDVLTVHHPDYYQAEGTAPAETDNPIPVPFVSAKGRFLIALELNPALDADQYGHWLKAAWAALREGLRRHGIGAKTNAGYGRFDLPELEQTEGRVRIDSERARIAAAAAAETERLAREHLVQQRAEDAAERERVAASVETVRRERIVAGTAAASSAASAVQAWLEAGLRVPELLDAIDDWFHLKPEPPEPSLRAFERTTDEMAALYGLLLLPGNLQLKNEVHSRLKGRAKTLMEAHKGTR